MKLSLHIILFALLLSCNKASSKKNLVQVHPLKQNTIKISITKVGVFNEDVILSYQDSFGNNVRYDNDFSIQNKYDLNIKTSTPVFLKDISLNQTSYVIYPGENIRVVAKNGELLNFQSIKNDTVRNNELNFFNALEEFSLRAKSNLTYEKSIKKIEDIGINLRSSQVAGILQILIKRMGDTKDAMLYANKRYKEQLDFLKDYSQTHKISGKFKKLVNEYLYFDCIDFQLNAICNNLKQNNRPDSQTLEQIDKWGSDLNCNNCLFIPTYQNAVFSFTTYIKLTNNDKTVLATSSDIRKNLRGKTADFATFTLIKNAMETTGIEYKTAFKGFNNYNKTAAFETYLDRYDKIKNLMPQNNTTLLKPDGSATTLNDLLKQNNGKIILFDFWASWCTPCRHDLSFSKKLKEKYKKSSVSIIYLSLDSQQSAWEAANSELNLSNSYLVVDNFKAALANELKINTIPRYVLLNKKGIMINKDAPRPDNKLLADLIDTMLKKIN